MDLRPRFATQAERYCQAIEKFWPSSPNHRQRSAVSKWQSRHDKNDPIEYEPALAEAVAWSYLEHHCNRVEVNDNPSHGGPDFKCDFGAGEFWLEVACLTRDRVARETGFPADPCSFSMRKINRITSAIFEIARGKATQFRHTGLSGEPERPKLPGVLFVVTFHHYLTRKLNADVVVRLLTGDHANVIEFEQNMENIRSRREVNFKNSFAIRAVEQENDVLFAGVRRTISAIVVAGFELGTPRCIGAIHPDAARRFSPTIMPVIPFASMCIDQAAGTARIRWQKGQGECDPPLDVFDEDESRTT